MSFNIITDSINTLIQNNWLDNNNLVPLWIIVMLCEVSSRFGASIVFKIIMKGISIILEFWLLMVSVLYFWSIISRIAAIILIIILVIISININSLNDNILNNFCYF